MHAKKAGRDKRSGQRGTSSVSRNTALALLEGGKKLKEAVEIEQNCMSIDCGNMVLWMLWYVIKSDRTQARDSDRHPTLLIDQGQSSLAYVLRK